jgi:hypothetical protein
MFNKIKELDNKLNDKLSFLNLSKKYPNYFTKSIFRLGLVLMVLIICYNFYLNDFSMTNIVLDCPASAMGGKCLNPAYDCQNDLIADNILLTFNLTQIKPLDHSSCVFYTSDQRLSYCSVLPCDKRYLDAGEHYGRTDVFVDHSVEFFILIIIFCFILNHGYYIFTKWLRG